MRSCKVAWVHVCLLGSCLGLKASFGEEAVGLLDYNARIDGREILTPRASLAPEITSARVFGVRSGMPIFFRVSSFGARPMQFAAEGLPEGVAIDSETGWVTGRAPLEVGDYSVRLTATNSHGTQEVDWFFRVGNTIALTPPMGWNSWYVHSEGVSEKAIREIAMAMKVKGLADAGWTYINIDDCWMGERDPHTLDIRPNSKFEDMRALAEFVNNMGFKLGIYSTPWMSTYAGYIGGSAPNVSGDYSEHYLALDGRQNPHQLFGRYPNGIRKGLAKIGPIWLVDRDARQFARWGIDYVKYDWKEWSLVKGENGFWPDESKPERKTLESGIIQRVYHDIRSVDRDIVISLSPNHQEAEDRFVPEYCNLWRLTGDIHAEWKRLIAPFEMESRLRLTRPGRYGDLDMLQIGPLGKPNRAEVVFKPSPLTPSEQYFQVSLWCLLTQPLLLSCDISSLSEFDLNLMTNPEVLAVNQDPLCEQAYRVANQPGEWELWAKPLYDGSLAVGMFNLSESDQVITVSAEQLKASGLVRDLWRRKDIGSMASSLSAKLSGHGALLCKVAPQ